MGPINKFIDRYKFWRDIIVCRATGRKPLSEFADRIMVTTDVKLPIEEGTTPLRRLLLRNKY
jgi:hypothetical protein